jgi:hypothetical protein
MSVIEQEHVLDQVLRRTARRTLSPRAAVWLFGGTAAAASVALALVLWPGAEPPAEFSSRGDDQRLGFTLACVDDSGPGACHGGSTLLFRTWAPAGQPFFASFAQGSDGTIIWYAPSRDHERSVDTRAEGPGGVLAYGVRIGPEHRIGAHTVYGLFSAEPLGKAEVRARVERVVQSRAIDPSLFQVELKVGEAP